MRAGRITRYRTSTYIYSMPDPAIWLLIGPELRPLRT